MYSYNSCLEKVQSSEFRKITGSTKNEKPATKPPPLSLNIEHYEFIAKYAYGVPMGHISTSFQDREAVDLKRELCDFLGVRCDFEMIKKSYELGLFGVNDHFKNDWRCVAYGVAVNAYYYCRVHSHKISGATIRKLHRKALYVCMGCAFDNKNCIYPLGGALSLPKCAKGVLWWLKYYTLYKGYAVSPSRFEMEE